MTRDRLLWRCTGMAGVAVLLFPVLSPADGRRIGSERCGKAGGGEAAGCCRHPRSHVSSGFSFSYCGYPNNTVQRNSTTPDEIRHAFFLIVWCFFYKIYIYKVWCKWIKTGRYDMLARRYHKLAPHVNLLSCTRLLIVVQHTHSRASGGIPPRWSINDCNCSITLVRKVDMCMCVCVYVCLCVYEQLQLFI
jgi:hypothetical protein